MAEIDEFRGAVPADKTEYTEYTLSAGKLLECTQNDAQTLRSGDHEAAYYKYGQSPAGTEADESAYYRYGQRHTRDPRYTYPGNLPHHGGVIYPGRIGEVIVPGYYPYPPYYRYGGHDHGNGHGLPYGYGYGRSERLPYGYGYRR